MSIGRNISSRSGQIKLRNRCRTRHIDEGVLRRAEGSSKRLRAMRAGQRWMAVGNEAQHK